MPERITSLDPMRPRQNPVPPISPPAPMGIADPAKPEPIIKVLPPNLGGPPAEPIQETAPGLQAPPNQGPRFLGPPIRTNPADRNRDGRVDAREAAFARHLGSMDNENRHRPLWVHPKVLPHLIGAFKQNQMVLPHPGVDYNPFMPGVQGPDQAPNKSGLSGAGMPNSSPAIPG